MMYLLGYIILNILLVWVLWFLTKNKLASVFVFLVMIGFFIVLEIEHIIFPVGALMILNLGLALLKRKNKR